MPYIASSTCGILSAPASLTFPLVPVPSESLVRARARVRTPSMPVPRRVAVSQAPHRGSAACPSPETSRGSAARPHVEPEDPPTTWPSSPCPPKAPKPSRPACPPSPPNSPVSSSLPAHPTPSGKTLGTQWPGGNNAPLTTQPRETTVLGLWERAEGQEWGDLRAFSGRIIRRHR